MAHAMLLIYPEKKGGVLNRATCCVLTVREAVAVAFAATEVTLSKAG